MGSFEQNLLQKLASIWSFRTRSTSQRSRAVSPNTPQLIYSNVSNLYQGLLTDWLRYADAHGVSRELAFYHVTQATPFIGNQPLVATGELVLGRVPVCTGRGCRPT